MKGIKEQLKQFEKMLSVKYLARDILLIQVCVLIAMIVAGLAFVGLVSYASTQPDPVGVMQSTHDKTSGIGFWIFYFVTNGLVFYIGNKHKKKAMVIKEEIIEEFEVKEEVKE